MWKYLIVLIGKHAISSDSCGISSQVCLWWKSSMTTVGQPWRDCIKLVLFWCCSHPRTLAFSPPFQQQWQQCCSCKACGPGSSFHTLAVVYLEEEYEEWEQPLGWNCLFPECTNVALGGSACLLLWQLQSNPKESVYTSRPGRNNHATFMFLIHIMYPDLSNSIFKSRNLNQLAGNMPNSSVISVLPLSGAFL